MSIIGALSMTSISRLKQTWANLVRKYPKANDEFGELSGLASPKQQYASYRRTLRSWSSPLLPFMGVFLTDLTMLDVSSSDFVVEGDHSMINFSKRLKVYRLLKEMEGYQDQDFDYLLIEPIYSFFLNLDRDFISCMDEDALYAASLEREPLKDEI
jgi:hypothetical protein